jgi:hypothetical protein
VLDTKVLDTPMTIVTGDVRANGSLSTPGPIVLIDNNAETALATLRYRLKDAAFDAAEEPFEAGGHAFARGSFIIRNASEADVQKAISELGLHAIGVGAAPQVKTHPLRAPRLAILHSWLSTQDEGWWRHAFEDARIPYTYINVQQVANDNDLRSKYDVVIFPPVGRNPELIVNGQPTDWGNAIPWKKTDLTPNLGSEDHTDDMRPGLGWEGVAHLQKFVKEGGLLLTSMDTANLAATTGLAPGVSVAPARTLKIVGSVVRSKLVDATSPIAYGYRDNLAIWCFNGPIFNVSNIVGARAGRRLGGEMGERPTGRGTLQDADVPQGRAVADIPEEPKVEAWQAQPVTDEQLRNGINVIPPDARPRVVLRFADTKDLLVSGLVEGGAEIAQHAAVIDAPAGKGHVVLFSNNPVWRGETQGNYFLVFNAILNFDHLDAGRALDKK